MSATQNCKWDLTEDLFEDNNELVMLNVIDITGKIPQVLVNFSLQEGTHEIYYSPDGFSSWIYSIQLINKFGREVQKLYVHYLIYYFILLSYKASILVVLKL